jgi:hypothetical protein
MRRIENKIKGSTRCDRLRTPNLLMKPSRLYLREDATSGLYPAAWATMYIYTFQISQASFLLRDL